MSWANVIGPLATIVVVPVPTLLDDVSPSKLPTVSPTELVTLTLPDVPLLKATVETVVSRSSVDPIPVAARRARLSAVMLVASPVSTSVISPALLESPVATPSKSAVMMTLPSVPSPLLLALTVLIWTLPGARSVIFPSCEETVEPSASVTLPAPDAFCRAPPSLKSVPALSRTSPVPAALIVTTGTEIVSPANRLILPVPPEAVTLSVRVRSSLASSVPSLPAATMMFPPPVAETTSMITPPLAESIVTFPADD